MTFIIRAAGISEDDLKSKIKRKFNIGSSGKKVLNSLYTALSILAFIGVWKAISVILNKEILVPSPETTLSSLIHLLGQQYFWTAAGHTLLRTFTGFAIALVSALVMGILAGFFKPLYYFFKPFNVIVKAMPTMSIILLALIWLNSEKAPLLVGFLIIFPILYGNVLEGIHNIDGQLIEMAAFYKVRKRRIITELYLPSISSYLFAASTAALGLNLKVMISAEVLSQPVFAIGRQLQMEKIYLNTANVFAWTTVVIVLVALFDYGLKKLRDIRR